MNNFSAYAFERFDSESERHIKLGNDLEAMRSSENPIMLPLGANIMAQHSTGIIVSQGNIAIGYNGIIFEYENGVAEMGGLYINPDFRGQGLVKPIKAELFNSIKEIDRIKKVITFANSNSLQLNLDLGFKLAKDTDVPSQSLANCAGCPAFNRTKTIGKICCDTILILDTKDLPELPTLSVETKAQ